MNDLSFDFAHELKSQLDIREVVGQYVGLKKQGAGPRYIGLCPFHSEKTPSFGVHSALQYYKCFACDAAGDVFTFIQKIEGVGFVDAVRLLADRYSIPIVSAPGAHRRRSNFADLATAELFRVGFRWALSRYLETLKQLWFLDELAVTPTAIRDATRLLELISVWTPWQAARFLKRFRRPKFVKQCVAEAREAQLELIRAITYKSTAAAA